MRDAGSGAAGGADGTATCAGGGTTLSGVVGRARGAADDAGSGRWVRRAAILIPVLVAALAFGLRLADAESAADPVVVASDAPRYDDVGDLVAASDAVVLAEIVDEGPGRVLGNDDSAVATHLVELRVVDVVAGTADASVVVEEPAALADGSPIAVDGVAPLEVGQRGVFFLLLASRDVSDTSRDAPGSAAPYAVTVGPQGSYLVDGDDLVAPLDDPLANRLAAGGGPALVEAVERLAR